MTFRSIAINFFRILLILIILLDFYNGFLLLHPKIPKISSWGTLWQGLLLTVLIGWLALEIANYHFSKTKVGQLPIYFWLIVLISTGGDSLANFFEWYNIPQFDKFMHFWGGFLPALIILEIFKKMAVAKNWQMKKWMLYYFTITTVNLGAVFYEIGELIGDKWYKANNIIGRFDTTEDLIMGLIGASVVIIFDNILYFLRK